MSSDAAIVGRGLGKEYRLGQLQVAFPTLRDEIDRALRVLLRRTEAPPRADRQLWALKDVDFEVERGEAVGVIGHNGAGKTTLLKILSRITPPTTGEVRISGRVGSLLEVGTGFHPELTGRENVFLNGAILGMRRKEIERRFDEIVAFAEVERFIDTPVKRYSSGMYVRLAFAVAAHLEPEILIVDEVLAVGDQAFQRKCLGKMGEVAGEGRTVLLVSHNMASIRTLTSRSIWLDHGRVRAIGPTAEVVGDYLGAVGASAGEAVADLRGDDVRRASPKRTTQALRFESVALIGPDGQPAARIPELTTVRLEIGMRLVSPVRFVEVIVRVRAPDGDRVFSCFSGQRELSGEPGTYTVSCTIPTHPLRPGRYSIELAALGADPQDIVPDALAFEVEAGHREEENPRYAATRSDGYVRVASDWTELQPADAGSEALSAR
ncbi:MAG: lipopolysaccharide transport system ATP-binding protein [Gaiellaceae bacterium]|jgi:lipopolysaccharide transport system ATP-binding protein|nr:lipopolysaccharide transport system ATP-binding protein [Gaiellaceae bacterium]